MTQPLSSRSVRFLGRSLATVAFGATVVLCAREARAASVTVCDTGCTYKTIAAALTGVGSGQNTITVKAPYSAGEAPTIQNSGAGAELVVQANTTPRASPATPTASRPRASSSTATTSS